MSEQPNEGSVLGGGIVQDCPISPLTHYHDPIVCETRPVRLNLGSVERKSIYEGLREGGKGATMVPNQHTSVCPLTVENLESETAVRGLDTTWIVENTSSKTAVVSWVVNGIEYSPYNPDILAIDDPKARVAPGEWLNVPVRNSCRGGGRALPSFSLFLAYCIPSLFHSLLFMDPLDPPFSIALDI